MKVLAFDTSTTISGYSMFIDGVLDDYGNIDLSGTSDTDKRMTEMVQGLDICLLAFNPDVVVVEETVVLRNPDVQRKLTMIVGALFGLCAKYGVDFHMLRPTEWRKYSRADGEKLPRKREELKEWSISRVKELHGIDVDDNTSDAILIGQAWINKENE